MDYELCLTFTSLSQKASFDAIMTSAARNLLIQGGSGSGKTYVSLIAVVIARAMQYPGSEHYLFKTDLKVLKNAFELSAIKLLRDSGIKEGKTRRAGGVYFYDEHRGEVLFRNGSRIYMRAIKSPAPSTGGRDAGILGGNAETIYVDEATTISYEWFEFLQTRCRSAKGCPPLMILTENPSRFSWTFDYFTKLRNPVTLEPLSEIEQKNAKVLRIETWENTLMDETYKEMLKNSGNAMRFYYGLADEGEDYRQIYTYDLAPFRFRMFNIYAIDPGYNDHAGIVQIGFGGDYHVNVRELYYKQGSGLDDYIREVDKIIELHEGYLDSILEAVPVGYHQYLLYMQYIPHIVVDSARPDLISDLHKHFNNKKMRVKFIGANKEGTKEFAIERVRKFKQLIDVDSKFYFNEIRKYRKDDKGRIPDGNDHLLDAFLYAARYILEQIYGSNPATLIYDRRFIEIAKYLQGIAA